MVDKQRLRRDWRSDTPPHMRLMQRDVDILKTVAEYRIMRQDQIQQLFFGSKSTAQYRLSHLYQHGFLARHFLPVFAGWSPTLYTLDKRGLAFLRTEYDLEHVSVWNADNGHEFLSHTLAITDVRIAITLACRAAGYTLIQWEGETDLKADYDRVNVTDTHGKSQSISLIPDSYFTLETPRGNTSCFLEMDMGTMTLGRFQMKIRAYHAYVLSGHYQSRYQTRSLRVLTVTNSTTRAENLKKSAEAIGAARLFWFTNKASVDSRTILHAPIWQVAGLPEHAVFMPR